MPAASCKLLWNSWVCPAELTQPEVVQVAGVSPVARAPWHQLSSIGVEVHVAHRLRHSKTWEKGSWDERVG